MIKRGVQDGEEGPESEKELLEKVVELIEDLKRRSEANQMLSDRILLLLVIMNFLRSSTIKDREHIKYVYDRLVEMCKLKVERCVLRS